MRRYGLMSAILFALPLMLLLSGGRAVDGPEHFVRPQAQAQEAAPRGHEFYFTRAVYTDRRGGGFGRWRSAWATDWPKADEQFLYVLGRLAPRIDAFDRDNAVRLDDPELRRYPFVYAVEVGNMALTATEVAALRSYLMAGGFLLVDDFWGANQWYAFESNMRRVLPKYQIVDLPLDHPLFNSYYEIKEIVQVPNVNLAQYGGGRTTECYGCDPTVKAIFDADGRLLVLISFNSDLGDAWEWAEQPFYPLEKSNYAFQLAVNAIVYAMSH